MALISNLLRRNNNFEKEVFIENEREHILNDKTGFLVHEAYNKLRSNIKFSLSGKGTKIILVTSTNPHEGKSINVLNIAVSYAEIGQKVIIIDCDMRKPKQHRLLNLALSPGLSNILVSDILPEKAIHHNEEYNIDIVCAGEIPPNSTTLLEADEMQDFLDFLEKKYDIVIFDTPPVNSVIDSCILTQSISEHYSEKNLDDEQTKIKASKKSVGVVFVVKQDYTKRTHLVEAVRQLEAANAHIVGFVLNDIKDKSILSSFKTYNYKNYRNYEYKSIKSRTRKYSLASNKFESILINMKVKRMELKMKMKTKNGHKIKIALICGLIIALISIGAVVHHNWDMIQMVYQGVTMSNDDIISGLEDNDKKIDEILKKITDKKFYPLSTKNRKQLANGTLSREDAIRLIKGLPTLEELEAQKIAENSESSENVDNTAQEENKNEQYAIEITTETQAEPKFTKKDEIIADIYLLRAEYLNEIDKLIADSKNKYKEMNGKGFSAKMDFIDSVTNEGNELEAACDSRMDELLENLKLELQREGSDTSVVNEIEELYKNEKKLKKAELVNTYYPK